MRIFFLILIFSLSHLFANSIESVLKIKPPIRYTPNQKYDKITKFKDKKDEKTNYDLGLDIGINKELMTIDKLRIDVGTKFKGIN